MYRLHKKIPEMISGLKPLVDVWKNMECGSSIGIRKQNSENLQHAFDTFIVFSCCLDALI